ncbi:MAG: hypothetical protein IPM57_06060 [Oligoflexia bacterium]|nr:hypothetical protein [Oligoflexia bacterium]
MFEQIKQFIQLHPITMSVASDSMKPHLNIGDKIKVKAATLDSLRKFDIIVFFRNDKFICHYVKYKNKIRQNGKKIIITQGSKLNHEDFPVFEDEFIGLVISHRLPLAFKLKNNILHVISKMAEKFGITL